MIAERLSGSLSGDWTQTLAMFRVPDAPAHPPPNRALLICESPHTDEVLIHEPMEARFPLRGATGKAVTKALIACREPLAVQHGEEGGVPVGQLVTDGLLNSVRIVNLCELPLQAEAYAKGFDDLALQDVPEALSFQEWCKLVRTFRTVRDLALQDVPEALSFQEWCKLVRTFRTVRNLRQSTGDFRRVDDPLFLHIVDDFRRRLGNLEQVRTGRALVCGLAARTCWCGLGLPRPSPSNYVRFVPHPSRQQWFKPGGLEKSVRKALQRIFATTSAAQAGEANP